MSQEQVKFTAEQLTALSTNDLLGAIAGGLADLADVQAEMARRQDEASGESGKKIKEIFTSKPNYLTVAFTGQGFPISATVRKWELIGEQIADIVSRAKQVRTAGQNVTGLKFYRKAKDAKPTEQADAKPTSTDNGNTGAQVANSLVQTGPLAGRTKNGK
jgi:hypothetical protein